MNLLNWREEMSLGIEDIDRQHYMFFEILGRLHEAATCNAHLSVLKGLAGDLCCYASLLFRGEEKFMALTQDPNSCSHLMEHAEFRHRVAQLELDGILSDKAAVRAATRALGDWLENHIRQFDHSLALRARLNNEPVSIRRPAPVADFPWMSGALTDALCESVAS